MGDFNVHFETSDKNSTDLANLLQQYGLSQMVNSATRISGYTLDLVFSNPFSLPSVANVHPELTETTSQHIKFDHYPIIFSLSDISNKNPNQSAQFSLRCYRNIKQIDMEAFNNVLEDKLSLHVNNQPTINSFQQQLESYNMCLSSAIDQFAPQKVKRF